MSLEIPQSLIDEMIEHAKEDAPNECCGIIGRADDGSLTLWRTTNELESPHRFNVRGQELFHLRDVINLEGWEFLVLYHSHVASEARPSPTDLRIAANWYQLPTESPYWVLVSLQHETPSIRAWRIDAGLQEDRVVASEIDLVAARGHVRASRIQLTTEVVDGKPRVRETSL